MDSPKRKAQKNKDYRRHRMMRLLNRRKATAQEAMSEIAERELMRRLRITPLKKFEDGKDAEYDAGVLDDVVITGRRRPANIMFDKDTGNYYRESTGDVVTPVNKLVEDDPSTWSFTDRNGTTFTPHGPVFNSNQGEIRQAEEAPFLSNNYIKQAAHNYMSELAYDINNNRVVGGKYTMPAIALAPFMGSKIGGAAINSAFAAHGLNHAINEGVDGFGDAVTTGLEMAPLMPLAKPIINAGYSGYNTAKSFVDLAKANRGFAVSTPYMGRVLGRTTAWVPFDRPLTKGISWMATGKPVEEGLPIEYITSKYPGEARKLYDAGINIAHKQGSSGLLVGDILLSAPKSYRTYEHYYPNRIFVDNRGFWTNRNMLSNPNIKGKSVYSLDDFLKETKEHPEEQILFSGAPRYRLEKPSTAEITARGDMISAMPGDADFSFKTPDKAADQLEQYMYHRVISGEEVDPIPTRQYISKGVPSDVRKNVIDNTIARQLAFMRNRGVPSYSLNNYEEQALDMLDNVQFGTFPKDYYVKAGKEHLGGLYNEGRNFISVREDLPTQSAVETASHEARHMLSDKLDSFYKNHVGGLGSNRVKSSLLEQDRILSEAYDQDFLNLPTIVDKSDPLSGYTRMSSERVTTNRDARSFLLNKHAAFKNQDLPLQDKLILNVSDEDIFKAVENSNGYGERYIKYLRDNNKLTHEKAMQFRNAMIKVGSVVPVAVGASKKRKKSTR